MADGFLQRLAVATGYVFRGALDDIEGSQIGSSLFGGILSPGGGTPPSRTQAEFLKAYSTMPWFRAALGRVSYDVAATQWKVFIPMSGDEPKLMKSLQRAGYRERRLMKQEMTAAGELQELENHPLLDLLDDANPLHTGTQMRRVTQIHIDAVGEGFWIIERNKMKLPQYIWPIPPSWIRNTATVDRPFFEIQFGRWHEMIPASEVIWFCDVDPANPYGRGSGTGRALGDELETDEYAARTVKARFYNQARPDLIISPKDGEDMSKSEARRFEEDWNRKNRGFWRSFRTHVMRRPVNIKEVEANFKSLQFIQIREFERDSIQQVFGVSPEILGIVKPGAARATITVADKIYARRVQMPRLEMLREIMQARLVPEYDERLVLDYENPVIEDVEQELNSAKAAPWSLMVDEWREMTGKQPLPDDEGQVFMVPKNMIPMASLTPVVGGNGDSSPKAEKGQPSAPKEAALEERRPGGADDPPTAGFGEWRSAFAEARDTEALKLFDALSATKAPDDIGLETSPLVPLAEELEPPYGIALVESWEGLDVDERALESAIESNDPDAAISAYGGIEVIRDAMLEIVEERSREAFMAGAEFAFNNLPEPPERALKQPQSGVSISFDAVNPAASTFARDRGAELVAEIGPKSRQSIATLIQLSNSLGISPAETARLMVNSGMIGLLERQQVAVANFYDRLIESGVAREQALRRTSRYAQAQLRLRAMTIARTETMMALNNGQHELWGHARNRGALDKALNREWLVSFDDRLCPECESVADEVVAFNAPFSVGLMYPPLHVLCRCSVGLTEAPVS